MLEAQQKLKADEEAAQAALDEQKVKTDALVAAQQKKLADEEAQRIHEAQQKYKAEEEAAQEALDLEKVKTDAFVAAQQKTDADEETQRVLNAQPKQVYDDALEFDDTGAEDEEGPAGVAEGNVPDTTPKAPQQHRRLFRAFQRTSVFLYKRWFKENYFVPP